MVGKEGTDSSFPIDTLTLTLTFHDPEQSLLYQLHWLYNGKNLSARALIYTLHHQPSYFLVLHECLSTFSLEGLFEKSRSKKATSASSEVLHSIIHPTSCVALQIFVSFSLQ